MVHPDDFRVDLAVLPAQDLQDPGKIYVYGDYLLINEREKGIHIFNNKVPSQPEPINFLAIPGNIDMAIRDNVLFADAYADLWSIDISDPLQPRKVSAVEDVFPLMGMNGEEYIASMTPLEETIQLSCEDARINSVRFFRGDALFVNSANAEAFRSSGSGAGSNTGVGGSMARFTIVQEYMYTVDNSTLNTWRLNGSNAMQESDLNLGWGIETIYPFGGHLFVGSQSGMFIVDISSPGQPLLLSEFRHANACDPVVTDGTYAYVTLRDGNFCEGFENQLDVVDIRDLRNPQLVKSYPMTNPHGLAVRDNRLFICDGRDGLKMFSSEDVHTIDENRLAHIKEYETFDVIALRSDLIMVIGPDGFYQYNLENDVLTELSRIPVK